MNRKFARQLIEQPGDETADEMFAEPIAGIFWVDWREGDDRIVELTAAAMGDASEPAPEWIDGNLHIRFRGNLTAVPLQFKPGEQDVTLLALNHVLAPDFEIRYVNAVLSAVLRGQARHISESECPENQPELKGPWSIFLQTYAANRSI